MLTVYDVNTAIITIESIVAKYKKLRKETGNELNSYENRCIAQMNNILKDILKTQVQTEICDALMKLQEENKNVF
jgi:hypothetical protein